MKYKAPAIFLDRDGTINVDYGYVYQIEKLEFLEGAVEGLKLLQDAGYILIIITNQSGVARGMYSIEQMNEFNMFMKETLQKMGVEIKKIYTCPHLKGCECRKPKLKLFYQAVEEFNIDLKKSFAIGDKMRDLSICEVEPVKGFLIGNEDVCKKNVKGCHNLLEAAEKIVEME